MSLSPFRFSPSRSPPMRDTLRVLVVDDEEPARERVTALLRRHPGVEASEAADGVAALPLLCGPVPPDLVFLDVQMPELSGLDLLRAIGADRMPLTVFATAYDQHAIAAFEAHAVDYLLKPFSDERFDLAFGRAYKRIAERGAEIAMRGMARLLADAPAPVRTLLVRSNGSIRLVRSADIERITGAGPYVELHLGAERVLHRASLAALAEELDPACFVRVHRSTIVNVDHIVRLEARPHGEFDAVLRNGSMCRVSRTSRPQLERHFGRPL